MSIKMVHLNVTSCVNLINVLCAHFSYKIFNAKISYPKASFVVFGAKILYKNRAHKMLMKLTPCYKLERKLEFFYK